MQKSIARQQKLWYYENGNVSIVGKCPAERRYPMNVTVADCLKLPTLREAQLIAGAKGTDRAVSSASVTGFLTQSVYSCATAWNRIDSNSFIRHYPSTYTGSYASADFTVRVRGVNSYGQRFGRLVPTPNNVNQNWTSAVIETSTESASANNSSYTHTDRQMNFLHELGHALKLAHPHESDSSWHPLSIMNQGLPSIRDYIPGRPSGYGKYNLSRKW